MLYWFFGWIFDFYATGLTMHSLSLHGDLFQTGVVLLLRRVVLLFCECTVKRMFYKSVCRNISI